jgi:hypothetical protein
VARVACNMLRVKLKGEFSPEAGSVIKCRGGSNVARGHRHHQWR